MIGARHRQKGDRWERELAESSYLFRQWNRWHAERLEAALDGVHGRVLTQLMEELKNLREARKLIDFVNAQDWSAIDTDTKFTALHQINIAICRLREKLGLPPIDDALPGEPLPAFQLIRKIVTQFPALAGRPARSVSGKKRVRIMSNEIEKTLKSRAARWFRRLSGRS